MGEAGASISHWINGIHGDVLGVELRGDIDVRCCEFINGECRGATNVWGLDNVWRWLDIWGQYLE